MNAQCSKTAIVFCVEKGILEQQAILLTSSYFKFAFNKDIQLIAVSPRKHNQPNRETKRFLNENNVIHLDDNLNTKYINYPIANKVLACCFVEENYPEFKSIIFVDTDTVFLNPINDILLKSFDNLYLRPVDNKGPGTLGRSDINDMFWQKLYELFGVDLPAANLTTTVRPEVIRPYFNAGFIWANGLPGFFKQWNIDFEKLVESGLKPFGYQSRDNTDFRCLDQVALAITSQRYKHNLQILPHYYNYPIPFKPMIDNTENHPKLNELIHVHYHKWFQHPCFLDYIASKDEKSTKQYIWLNENLPLTPVIQGEFKC